MTPCRHADVRPVLSGREGLGLLSERWSFIIMRNIVIVGCRTFNEIAVDAGLSRGLLSKRLRELERAGVIEIRPKSVGMGSTYEPTEQGGNWPRSFWLSDGGARNGPS